MGPFSEESFTCAMKDISFVLIVKNEAQQVERTLKSIAWAKEIVVVDAFSTDATVAICRRYTDKVFQFPWEGFSVQRRRSVELAGQPWIFSIDADEVVSEALREEIAALPENPGPVGFWVPRKTQYLNRWISHCGWFPDYQLRLFRKDRVLLPNRAVHEGFAVRGETARLKGILQHYSYRSLSQHLEKINRYTTLETEEKMRQLKGKPVHWYHLLFNPLSRVWRMYVANKGFLDGFQGFLLSVYSAFYTHVLYAKIWEKQHATSHSPEKGPER